MEKLHKTESIEKNVYKIAVNYTTSNNTVQYVTFNKVAAF